MGFNSTLHSRSVARILKRGVTYTTHSENRAFVTTCIQRPLEDYLVMYNALRPLFWPKHCNHHDIVISLI